MLKENKPNLSSNCISLLIATIQIESILRHIETFVSPKRVYRATTNLNAHSSGFVLFKHANWILYCSFSCISLRVAIFCRCNKRFCTDIVIEGSDLMCVCVFTSRGFYPSFVSRNLSINLNSFLFHLFHDWRGC